MAMQHKKNTLEQNKLNDEISSKEKAMEQRVDLKIEEIKGEIKFLMGAFG